MSNKLWESHRIMYPELREKAVSTSVNADFLYGFKVGKKHAGAAWLDCPNTVPCVKGCRLCCMRWKF